MRREDIANFLNAERRISPLTAFSLLIVAGFFAGSLQIVAPMNPNSMMAVVEGTEHSLSELDSEAPDSCTSAIKAALGKSVGPSATTVAQGDSGTADACFGGVLADPVRGTPSQNTADYKCVGRSGKVTFTPGSAVSTTKPDKDVPMGKCKVQVCSPITTIVDGKPVVNENCGQPKQFNPGQQVSRQTGGVPSLPQIPSGGGGGDGGGGSTAPDSGGPLPNVPQPSAGGTGGTDPFEEPKDEVAKTVTDADAIRNATCDGSPDCPLGLEPEKPKEGAKLNEFGEPVTGDSTDMFTPPRPDASMLDGTLDPGTTNTMQPPLQTSTFEPVKDGERGLGTVIDPAQTSLHPKDSPSLDRGVQDQKQLFEGRWADAGGQIPSVQEEEANKRSSLAQGLGINDIGKGKWTECSDAYCMGYNEPTLAVKSPTDAECAGTPECYIGRTANGNAPAAKPSTEQPPAQKPPPEVPPAQRPPSTIPDPQTAPRPTTGGGLFGGSGVSPSGIMSFLGGFMKGLGVGQPAQQAQGRAQACPTDPQAFAQYQQDYNYRLQQYNYQLQQYNYQQQNNQAYGYTTSAAPPPPAPQPCRQGLGTGDGQCPQLPPQPSPTTCPTGTWRQMTATGAGIVCPVWQCVANNATTPTAQIACNPDVAEKGSRVTISYTCTNSQRSTGYGFETNGATAGAATVTIDNPPASAAGINYAVKCEDGSVTAGAQCSVQIAKVSISMRAEPEVVPVGHSALIGYVTTGMKSCVISSPDQPDFTDRNAGTSRTTGIATTSIMTEKSDFVLNCITVTGESREEKITIDVYRPGTVSASIENRTDVVRGSSATLRWSFPDAPDLSAVALWLYSVEEEKTVALISGHRAKTGTLTWNLPTEDDDCNMSSSIVCGTDLIPGATYAILASLYQPVNANLGEFNDPSLPEPKFIDNPISAAFKVVQ